jgi:hypothetical protein
VIKPETMLKAARIAKPHLQWVLAEPISTPVGYKSIIKGCNVPVELFNPHDPTKGDLAALEHALQRAGWQFWYAEIQTDREFYEGKYFAVFGDELSEIDAKTPAERALLCVEAMP